MRAQDLLRYGREDFEEATGVAHKAPVLTRTTGAHMPANQHHVALSSFPREETTPQPGGGRSRRRGGCGGPDFAPSSQPLGLIAEAHDDEEEDEEDDDDAGSLSGLRVGEHEGAGGEDRDLDITAEDLSSGSGSAVQQEEDEAAEMSQLLGGAAVRKPRAARAVVSSAGFMRRPSPVFHLPGGDLPPSPVVAYSAAGAVSATSTVVARGTPTSDGTGGDVIGRNLSNASIGSSASGGSDRGGGGGGLIYDAATPRGGGEGRSGSGEIGGVPFSRQMSEDIYR